jgi:uncharacterized protein
MLSALVLSGFLLGLAGSPHCVAMCGGGAALCLSHGGNAASPRTWLWFNAARIMSYGFLGVVVGALFAGAAQLALALRAAQPLWVLLHTAIAAWGFWLMLTARQPVFLARVTSGTEGFVALAQGGITAKPLVFARRAAARPWRIGLLWGALPCGLLYSACLSAALAANPWQAGLVMLAFGVGTSAAFVALPVMRVAWQSVLAHAPRLRALNAQGHLAIRAGGALLCMLSAIALFTDVQARTGLWCG